MLLGKEVLIKYICDSQIMPGVYGRTDGGI